MVLIEPILQIKEVGFFIWVLTNDIFTRGPSN